MQTTTPDQSVKLRIRKITKSFSTPKNGRLAVLEPVDLDVRDGEFICLVGPSGCGKTTLLNILAGLEQPDTGEILEDGIPINSPGQDRLVMFQESALFPWLTVFGNVMYGLNLKPGLSKAERRDIAETHLKMVGLEQFMHSHIHQLSGGMKQRVALARSLAPNPKVLLMDEPFASLDAMTREQFYNDLQRIRETTHKTIILVTHNIREAACLGDRVFLFSPRPGRIYEEFKILLPRPRDINTVQLAEYATQIQHAMKNRLNRE